MQKKLKLNKNYLTLKRSSEKTFYSEFYLKKLAQKKLFKTEVRGGKIYTTEEWLAEFLSNYTFEAFLKKMSVSLPQEDKAAGEEIKISEDYAVNLKKTLARIKSGADIDDEQIGEWLKSVAATDKEFKNLLRAEKKKCVAKNILNMKIVQLNDPLAKAGNSLAKKTQSAKQETLEKLSARPFMTVVLASVLMALALSVSAVKYYPREAAASVGALDKIFAYSADALTDAPAQEKKPGIFVPDKKALSDYIAAHQEEINNSSAGVLYVSESDLAGRVAGACEDAAQPEKGIFKDKISNALKSIGQKQVELSEKANKKLENFINP